MKNGVFCPLSDSGRGCPFFAHCGRVFWCVGGVGVVVWESGRACVPIGLPNSRKRATAHGLRCPFACGCACRPCPCRLFLSVRQCYLFIVDNIAPMVGGILQPNGNRKTANSMCPLFHTPTFLSPNTEHIPFGRRFRKPSQ